MTQIIKKKEMAGQFWRRKIIPYDIFQIRQLEKC